MATNSIIQAIHFEDLSLALRLFGDIDATSACELILILRDSVSKMQHVCIHTDELRNIDAFGLDVLRTWITWLNRNRLCIEVMGRFSGAFQERNQL